MFYARTFTLAVLLVLGFLLYQILLPFFSPIAWALFIAFLILPIHEWLSARLRGRRRLSAALLTLATIAILVGPLAALGAGVRRAGGRSPALCAAARDRSRATRLVDIENMPVIGTALAWLQQTMGFSLEQIRGWAIDAARAVLGFFGSLGRQIFFGALGAVLGFALMIFILFFAILDGRDMAATLRMLIPMSPGDRKRLVDHLAAVTRAMVYGTGVTALVQGALIGIGFAGVGLPSPIVFGVVAALCALVPMLGTPIVWVPAVLVLAAQQRWGATLFLLIWGIFVVTIDNFLRPWLVAGKRGGACAHGVHRRAGRRHRVRPGRHDRRTAGPRARHRPRALRRRGARRDRGDRLGHPRLDALELAQRFVDVLLQLGRERGSSLDALAQERGEAALQAQPFGHALLDFVDRHIAEAGAAAAAAAVTLDDARPAAEEHRRLDGVEVIAGAAVPAGPARSEAASRRSRIRRS